MTRVSDIEADDHKTYNVASVNGSMPREPTVDSSQSMLVLVGQVLKESIVNVLIILLLAAVVVVQFNIIGVVQKVNVDSQSELIVRDVKRHIGSWIDSKTQVTQGLGYFMNTGQFNFEDQTRQPLWSEVNGTVDAPNPMNVRQWELATSPYFINDPDLVALYTVFNTGQTWKMHHEKPEVLASHFRYQGTNATDGSYCCWHRYERYRNNKDKLENFTLGGYKESKYIPFEKSWVKAATASFTTSSTGEISYVPLWKGPAFQGTGDIASTDYGLDPVVEYLWRVVYRDGVKFAVFKLKILTKKLTDMLLSLDIGSKNGDIAIVNAEGQLVAYPDASVQVIPDPDSPTDAKKAKVAQVWDLPIFSSVTQSVCTDTAKILHPTEEITVVSIGDIVPGWKVVIFLDGATLVQDVKPYTNVLLALAVILIALAVVSIIYSVHVARSSAKSAAAASRSELLNQMIPAKIASRVISRVEWPICDHHEDATTFFADIVGFTKRSSGVPPQVIVMMMNAFVEAFDVEAKFHKVEKIKTIGDCYMAVTGVPEADNNHAENAVRFGLACQAITNGYNAERPDEQPVLWRIGIHSGKVIAAVVGRSRFLYDVYGDNVNIASRVESNGAPARIRVSAATYNLVNCSDLVFSSAEGIMVKGKDKPIMVQWLETEAGAEHIKSRL